MLLGAFRNRNALQKSMVVNFKPKVLNPVLYEALVRRFGDVKVSSAGLKASLSYYKKGKRRFVNVTGGEYYCVNCPLCKDTRNRLWISHMYGAMDKVTRRRIWGCAVCFNETCDLSKLDLPDLLRTNFHALDLCNLQIKPEELAVPALKPITLPTAEYVSLPDLPARHPARAYLEARGFDIGDLDKYYCWKYVHNCRERFAQRRIMLPVIAELDDELKFVGYQTRAVPGLSTYDKPKYWTMPGFSKSSALFNLPIAKKHDVVVVTEGLMDAVKVGFNAVAIFGKSMSMRQISLLATHCSHAKIVVLLDSDAHEVSARLRDMMASYNLGKVTNSFSNGVYRVQLPNGDPGDYTKDELRRMINDAIG